MLYSSSASLRNSDDDSSDDSDSPTSSSENESLTSTSNLSTSYSSSHHSVSEEWNEDRGSSSSSTSTSSDSDDNEDRGWAFLTTKAKGGSRDRSYVVPRKVLRIRTAVYEALECALCIAAERQAMVEHAEVSGEAQRSRDMRNGRNAKVKAAGESKSKGKGRAKAMADSKLRGRTGMEHVHRPWTRLVDRIKTLHTSLDEAQAQSTDNTINRCIDVLNTLIEDIAPSTRDKAYLHTLSGAEARAARAFHASCLPVEIGTLTSQPSSNVMSLSRQTVDDTPPLILLRLARYALDTACSTARKKRYLDFSNMPFHSVIDVLEGLDVDDILLAFGIDVGEVTHVDLSNNQLDRMPFWSIFPFTNLQVLNISRNPLRYLPLSMIRDSALRRVRHRHTRLHPRINDTLITPPSTIPQNPPYEYPSLPNERLSIATLTDRALVALLRYQNTLHPDEKKMWKNEVALSLPSHLARRIRASWTCDLCFRAQVPPGTSHSEYQHAVRVGWQLNNSRPHSHSSSVVLNGKVCGLCRRLYGFTNHAPHDQ